MTTADRRTATRGPRRPTARSVAGAIPFTRVLWVELRKMFDTRSGFWLMVSIAISAVIATGAVILFAPESALTYDTFGAAIGFPMAVILPIIAILSVTSEWSQRSGLTTFTLVPHRGRVILAKAVASVGDRRRSMLLAFGIGAVGNVVGSAIAGVDPVWDISLQPVALHRPGQRARPARRLHARGADPQLARRDRGLLRLRLRPADADHAARDQPAWFATCSPGWTSTTPRARSSTANLTGRSGPSSASPA